MRQCTSHPLRSRDPLTIERKTYPLRLWIKLEVRPQTLQGARRSLLTQFYEVLLASLYGKFIRRWGPKSIDLDKPKKAMVCI